MYTTHFYLNGELVGFGKTPLKVSYHYISPRTGKIWGTVQIPEAKWLVYFVPAPGEDSSPSRVAGDPMLDFCLRGTNLKEIPRVFLQLELKAQYEKYHQELTYQGNTYA